MEKDDISNSTLALLVGVAILVSLVGIFSVKQPGAVYSVLTGYAITPNATVSAEVTRNVNIGVTGTISFGTGFVYQNNSAQPFVLNSTGNCASVNSSFAGASCTSSDDSDNKIVVQNDGNVNVTVYMDINSSNANLGLGTGGDIGFWLGQEEAATLTGSTDRPACLNETGEKSVPGDHQIQFANNTGFRVRGLNASIKDPGLPPSIYSVFGGASLSSQVKICSKLQPDDSFDAINVTIYMNVSKSVAVGGKNFLLNFTAVDAFTTEG